MTSTLLLKLSGPLQSWGHQGRFDSRTTGSQPTKSGVLGLIAAAQGRRRSDSLEDLLQLRFAVRIDQPGKILHDYQTAQTWQEKGKPRTSLVSRYFLQDAVFLAAVESQNRTVLEGIREAVRHPRFPLYLGRRSCPANWDLIQGIVDVDAVKALHDAPWLAGVPHRRSSARTVYLPIYRDAAGSEAGERRQDVPLSFDQGNREYGWRTVVEHGEPVTRANELGQKSPDPFFDTVVQA